MINHNEIERFQHAGRTVVLSYDTDPVNPRTDYENLSILFCWHPRLDLGDTQTGMIYSKEEMKERCSEEILAILPLYIYQHSGITIATAPFSCQWDSGLIGWAYITASRAKEWGCKGWSQEKLEDVIHSDVKEYDYFLQGQCFGYSVLGLDDEILDDCWGFLGNLDDCRDQAKIAAEHSEDPGVQERADELAMRPTLAGPVHSMSPHIKAALSAAGAEFAKYLRDGDKLERDEIAPRLVEDVNYTLRSRGLVISDWNNGQGWLVIKAFG